MTLAVTRIRTQDGTVIVCCADIAASGATRADAERRLAEKRNTDSPRLPSSQNRTPAA